MANRTIYPQTRGERELMRAYESLLVAYAELQTDFNALLAKLDADNGVTDTDYASTLTLDATLDTVSSGTSL